METPISLTIQPQTHAQVIARIPHIIEGLADQKGVSQIAEELGIDRVTVWKNLQRVDFKPIVSMLVTQTLEEMDLIKDPERRLWMKVQLIGRLHSKRIKTDATLTLHRIDETRQTLRLELDRLTPGEQVELQRLQAKMIVVDASVEAEPTEDEE